MVPSTQKEAPRWPDALDRSAGMYTNRFTEVGLGRTMPAVVSPAARRLLSVALLGAVARAPKMSTVRSSTTFDRVVIS
jgi:hypothetical protein